MGSFNGFLDAEFRPPRNWSLISSLKFKSETLTREQRDLLVELVRRKRIKLLNILRYEKSCSDYVNAEKTTNEINLCSKTLVTLQKI